MHLALLGLAAIALLVAFHLTQVDLRLASAWYDPVHRTWPWRYAWITKYGIHRYLKVFEIVLGVLAWCIALRANRARDGFLGTHRRRLWCIAVSFVAVPVVIGLLHRFSPMHCPWDVADFGGHAAYFDLLREPPTGVPIGRCFPAAFVSSGSWLLAAAWLRYPERPRVSIAIGLVALAWAFALGWVQQMRGAHFLSHTLWSLWVSWLVVLSVHYACGAWREGGQTPVRASVATMNRARAETRD